MIEHRPRSGLVVNASSAESGGEIALHMLLQADAMGEVTVLLHRDGPLVDRLAKLEHVSVIIMTKGSQGTLLSRILHPIRVARHYMSAPFRGYTYIYLNSLRAQTLSLLMPRRKGVKVIAHLRDAITVEALGPIKFYLARTSLKRQDAFIANSAFTLETAAKIVGGKPSRIISSPIGEPFFSLQHRGSETFSVVMLGRLSPWKGQLEFMEAIALAFDRLPAGFQVHIVGGALFGEEDYVESLKQYIDQHGLGATVQLHGHQSDVTPYLGTSDLMVHYSTKPEPFGQVVAQGMAAGLPVIAAAAGGPLETIEHGVDGWLVPPQDPQALAEALVEMSADATLRRSLGERAKISATKFRAAEIAEETQSFIKSVTT